ncbi:MAG: hypothetical protein NZ561_12710, partial [Phycisphaerae bacterium]|nr:hypothetical protein [Phycisphaerae bacterium]
MIEAVEPRRLLATLPLNPVNPRPITDPDFQAVPVPRAVLTQGTKVLVVIGTAGDDEIVLSPGFVNGANRLLVAVNDQQVTIRLRDVIRITVLGNLGNDEIRISGDGSLLATKRVALFGDDRTPFVDAPEGNDSISGFGGRESLFGGGGNDSLAGLGGNDVIDGGTGNDTLNGGVGNDSLLAGDFSGPFGGNNLMQGSDGNDTVVGGNNDDTILGGA